MNKMLSVVVPVYNVERYLDECMESLLAQTYSPIEFILVNDGSTDGSAVICDRYAALDERVRVFHKSNSGVSAARNLGIREARGEYVTFIDSDDSLCSSEAYADCMRIFDLEPGVSWVQFGVQTYVDGSKPTEIRDEADPAEVTPMVFERKDVLEALKKPFEQGFIDIVCDKIFKRSALIDKPSWGGVFPVGRLYEDTLFIYNFLFSSSDDLRICHYPRVYYLYRLGRVGATTSSISERHIRDIVHPLWTMIEEQEQQKVKSELIPLYLFTLYILIDKLISLYFCGKDYEQVINDCKHIFKGLRCRLSYFYKDISRPKYIAYLFFPRFFMRVNRWLGRW